MAWLIVAAVALALGAGLCASAEVALMRVSRSGAGELARGRKGSRNRAATRLRAVLAEPARYLAVLLLARVCGETAAIVLVAAALLHWLGTANIAVPLQNATNHVKVTTANGTITVSINGTQLLATAVTLPSSAYLGFSAGTGGSNNRHAISRLVVTSP